MRIRNLGVYTIQRVHKGVPKSYFKFPQPHKIGNSRYAFIDGERVPHFEGDFARAEIDRADGEFRVARIVEILPPPLRPW
jgi:uncharacterized protein YijF (DUF1287 family)